MYLHVWEICSHNTIHDTPHMLDGVFVMDLNTKLLPNGTPGSLCSKQIFGAHDLLHVRIHVLDSDLHWIFRILPIVLERGNDVGTLHHGASLCDLVQEHLLDFTLVDERGERIPRVDERGANGPIACPVDTLPSGQGIPESDIVDQSRIVGHQRALQAKVSQDLDRPGLDSIGTSRFRRYVTVIDVLHFVSPSRQAERQQEPDRTCADYDNVVKLCGGGHTGRRVVEMSLELTTRGREKRNRRRLDLAGYYQQTSNRPVPFRGEEQIYVRNWYELGLRRLRLREVSPGRQVCLREIELQQKNHFLGN